MSNPLWVKWIVVAGLSNKSHTVFENFLLYYSIVVSDVDNLTPSFVIKLNPTPTLINLIYRTSRTLLKIIYS